MTTGYHLPMPAQPNAAGPAFTTQVTVPAGSVTAPGLAITGDTDTGIAQLAGPGTLSLVGQGTESLRAVPVEGAVNRVEVSGSTAGMPALVRTAGPDADVDLVLQPQGNGTVSGADGLLRIAGWNEAGGGMAAFAGTTHIFSCSRSDNGLRIASFDDVQVATGASIGPLSGSIQLVVQRTTSADRHLTMTGAVAPAHPRIGTNDGALVLAPASAAVLLPVAAAPPDVTEDGAVYFDTTLGKLRVRAGGAWVDLH